MAQRGSELKFSIQICILMLNFHCVTQAALTEKFLVQLFKYLPRLLFSNQKLIYLSLLPSSMIPASWQRSWHAQILQQWYHNFNMNFESCSFRQIKKIACGSSRNLSQMVKVDECQDTITTQLETCHLSKSGLSEAELILGTLCNRTVEGRRRQNLIVWPAWQLDSSAYLRNFRFTTAVLLPFTTWKQALWGREENVITFIQLLSLQLIVLKKNWLKRGQCFSSKPFKP